VSWFDELQPASFRGVPFAVLGGESRFGRRKAIHQYPRRDTPYNEDLGRSVRGYSLRGFLVEDSLIYGGGSAIDQRDAMIAAVETAGSGLLVHPTFGQIMVDVLDGSVSFSESMENGRVFEVTFGFVEAGKRIFPAATQSTSSTLSTAAANLDSGAGLDFIQEMTQTINLGLGAVQGVLSLGNAIVSQVVSCVVGFNQLVNQASNDATSLVNLTCLLTAPTGMRFGRYVGANVSSAYVAGQANSGISQLTIATLIAQAAEDRQTVATASTGLAGAAAALDAASAPSFPASAQAVTAALSSAIVNPGDAIRLFASLAAYSPPAPAGSGQINAGQAWAQSAVSALLRRAAIGALGRAVATYTPSSYNDAISVMTTATTAIDNEILVAGDNGDDNTYFALRALRQAIVVGLKQAGANLSQLATFNFSTTLPSLVLAQRLYQDATRDDQLISQVNPVHPAFMPLNFQALAQ
jgi:prophage DNA circulation protein